MGNVLQDRWFGKKWGAPSAALLPLLAVAYFISTQFLKLNDQSATIVTAIATGIPGLNGALFCVIVARKSTKKFPWIALGFGQSLAAVGELSYNWILLRTGTEPASPHFTDFFYLGSYAVIGIAMLSTTTSIVGFRRLLVGLDSLVVAFGGGLALWFVLLQKLFGAEVGSSAELAYGVAYPVGGLFMLWATLTACAAALLSGKNRPFAICSLFAVSAIVISDWTWAYSSAFDSVVLGSWPDQLLTAGYCALAFAAVFGWRGLTAKSDDEAGKVRTNVVLAWIPMGVGTLAAVIGGGFDYVDDVKFTPITIAAVFVISLLTGLRQAVAAMASTREISLLNETLEAKVKDRTLELQSQFNLVRELNSTLDCAEVVSVAASKLAQEFPDYAVAVVATREDGSKLPEQTVLFGEFSPETKNTIVGEKLLATATSIEWHDTSVGLRQVCIVPLISSGALYGWIVAESDREISSEDQNKLSVMGVSISSAYAHSQLYSQALDSSERDYLTSLYNHRAVSRRMETYFAQDEIPPLGLLLVDVDNFKSFNDTYGPGAGDDVLRCLGRELASVAPAGSWVGRAGADEFIVVLPKTDLKNTYRIASQIQKSVKELEFRVKGGVEVLPISVTVGVAGFPDSTEHPYSVLAFAGQNLIEAKRYQIPVYDPSEQPKSSSVASGVGGTIDMFLTAIDNMDSYTRRHSEDVTQFSQWIGQEMGCSLEFMQTLSSASLLHDIGKIAVPSAVLRKPGKLTDEEVDLIKQHPYIGSLIVRALPGLEDTVDGVLYHHEKIDGTGYPEGLTGSDIPFLARVISVADAFSAMTTDRTYRKGMDFNIAADRLVEGIGTHFDEQIVFAFLMALQNRGLIEQPKRKAA
ncbi:MAG: diguanylate cyclase [Armatimonadetes bacterium]|nr:diguanylate cyclase [Armatimonadota bacterium]